MPSNSWENIQNNIAHLQRWRSAPKTIGTPTGLLFRNGVGIGGLRGMDALFDGSLFSAFDVRLIRER
jgi:hypothetical protein